MSTSAYWRFPEPRLDPDRIRASLRRAVGPGAPPELYEENQGATCVFEVPGPDGTALSCVLEIAFEQPSEGWRHEIDLLALAFELPDADDDSDGGWPSPLGLGLALRDQVTVCGAGRSLLHVRLPGTGRLEPIVARRDWDFDRSMFLGLVQTPEALWAYGSNHLCRRDSDGWRAVATGLEPDLHFTAFHPAGDGTLWGIDASGALWRVVDGRSERIEAVQPAKYYDDDVRTAIVPRGEELWIANNTHRLYRISAEGVRPVRLRDDPYDDFPSLCVAGDGRVWVTDGHRLYVGDGERWELAWAAEDATIRGELRTDPRGAVWATGARGGRGLLLKAGNSGIEETPLPELREAFSMAFGAPDRLWLLASDLHRRDVVVCVQLAGPPHTELSIRSGRNDNRAGWEAACAVADRVARDLGGWDATEG